MCIWWPMIYMMMLYDVKMLYMWCNVYMMSLDMHEDATRCEYAIYAEMCVCRPMMHDDTMWCENAIYVMQRVYDDPFHACWFYVMWKCYIWTNEIDDDAMMRKCYICDEMCIWGPMKCMMMLRCEKCYICDAMCIWRPIVCMMILCDVKMLYMDQWAT